MSTLVPRKPYSDDELKRLYPDNLHLEQVQVLLRHGERTPVGARFKNAGLPVYWPYCNAVQQMRAVMLSPDGSWDALTYRRRLETFNQDDSAMLAGTVKGESDGICLMGELTDLGRRTTVDLGSRLRELYINRLKFLSADLTQSTQDQLYLRATPIPRALTSVQQTFLGLYPASSRKDSISTPVIITRQAGDETLFPNEGACKRFKELSAAFADHAAQIWNDSPELKYVNSKIGKWMPADSPAVKVDSHPRLSGVMDTINSTKAHGAQTKLPSEFYDPTVAANIDRVAVDEWFAGYRQSLEYRRLGIGSLVGDITARLVERARAARAVPLGPANALAPGSDVRFALSGCHDTTLAALLTSLGAFDKEPWPPYTSHIAVELFRDASASSSSSAAPAAVASGWWPFSSAAAAPTTAPAPSRAPLADMPAADRAQLDGFFVRLRYNDKVMPVPGCRVAGKHREGDEGMCTLAAFKEIVDRFTPRDWRAECGTRLGEPAMGMEEKAGY